MKNILLNKKWLGLIALFLLVLCLSSCSGIGYWGCDDARYPWIPEILDCDDFSFFPFLSTVSWVISIIGVVSFFMGKWDDYEGGSHWININGKTHHIINYDEITSIDGTGSTKRGHSWSNNILAIALYAIVAYFIYTTLKDWFGGINGLVAVILGIVYIFSIINIHSKVKPIIGTVKIIAWIYTAIDCILGTLILLWDLTI